MVVRISETKLLSVLMSSNITSCLSTSLAVRVINTDTGHTSVNCERVDERDLRNDMLPQRPGGNSRPASILSLRL